MFLLLIIFCSAACVAKTSEEEVVSIFATVIALITLVFSIVVSPWFVQVAILIYALLWQFPLRKFES